MSQDLIPLTEAAALIGKNLRTIQRYNKAGTLMSHAKDGRSFISCQELESKYSIKETTARPPAPPPPVRKETTKTVPPVKTKVLDYQTKWVEEIQKHAQTREELGTWKGRAEAYQNFASRLLGNGKTPDLKNAPETKKEENVTSVTPSTEMPKAYTFAFYLVLAILAIIFILLLGLMQIFRVFSLQEFSCNFNSLS